MKNILEIKTEDFTGPLDLLVYLIDNKKLDISNIILSTIIDEYLSIIDSEKEQNLKIKVEFLAMSSELLEIKAYSILNKEKKVEKEKNLEKRILEYKIVKDIANEFLKREVEYNKSYLLQGIKKKNKDNIFYSIEELKLNSLINIYKELMINNSKIDRLKIEIVDNFNTEDALFEIESSFKIDSKILFSKLFKNDFSKHKIVTFFLAILDLFKTGNIDIEILENDFEIRKVKNV